LFSPFSFILYRWEKYVTIYSAFSRFFLKKEFNVLLIISG
jgi:hypothetical protein